MKKAPVTMVSSRFNKSVQLAAATSQEADRRAKAAEEAAHHAKLKFKAAKKAFKQARKLAKKAAKLAKQAHKELKAQLDKVAANQKAKTPAKTAKPAPGKKKIQKSRHPRRKARKLALPSPSSPLNPPVAAAPDVSTAAEN